MSANHKPENNTPETRLPGWGTRIRTLINGVRVRDCRSLRGRKSDQCHSREGLFLVSHIFGIYPFCVTGWRTRQGSICKAIGAKKIFFIEMGATCAGHVTEKTLMASCKIWSSVR